MGKTIDFLNGRAEKLQIVGVVKDFHYGTVKLKIQPQVFTAKPDMPYCSFIMRINAKDQAKTIANIQSVYKKILKYRPFKYDFLEDLNRKNYESEARWKHIITFGAVLMIFISCIGLFGLTTLSVQQRTKEIGIRKVLGANLFQISTLLSKNYIVLVLIAFVLAIPLAWFATNKWLENFAYKVEVSWQGFFISVFFTILIAFLTVSYQSIRAALMNPVKSLKTE